MCLVILRGEAFRRGGHRSRQTTGLAAVQINALKSTKTYLLTPLKEVGWNVRVALDVTCGDRRHELIKAIADAGVDVYKLRTRASIAEGRTQPDNLQSTCTWAYDACTKPHERGSALVIVTRVDVRWKREPLCPIPEPGLGQLNTWRSTIVGLWDCVPRAHQPTRRLVNDVLFYMTGYALLQFVKALRILCKRGDMHMHDLTTVFNGIIRVMRPEYIDANPQRVGNDCYSLIGRPEARPIVRRNVGEPVPTMPCPRCTKVCDKRTPSNLKRGGKEAVVLNLMR